MAPNDHRRIAAEYAPPVWWSRWLAAVVAVACLTGTAQPQARPAQTTDAIVTGRVFGAGTVVGLAGVEVLILGGSRVAMTDSTGGFHAVLTNHGTVTLVLRKLGYGAVGVPLEVDAGDSLHVATTMTRLAQGLDTLRVITQDVRVPPPRYAAFERRRALAQGTFITSERLERTGSTTIGDVLRGIPSIRVRKDELGMLVIESGRGGRGDRPCRIPILLNGQVMPFDVPLPVSSPKDLHGIEVYAGPASMPRELIPRSADSFCGLIAIWTK